MNTSLALTPSQTTAKLYADALIAAHGRVALAAEFLSKASSSNIEQHEVLSVMAESPNELARVGASLRTAAILRLFEMQEVVHEELVGLVNESGLEGADIARLYSNLTHEIMAATHNTTTIQITSPEQQASDHNREFMERLPPEVRRAVVHAAEAMNAIPITPPQDTNGTSDHEN